MWHKTGLGVAISLACIATFVAVVAVQDRVSGEPAWPSLTLVCGIALIAWGNVVAWGARRWVAAAYLSWGTAFQPWLWSAMAIPLAFAFVSTFLAVRDARARRAASA